MKFLLDTNFLMIPAQFTVDVFAELTKFGRPELYTLDLVVKELETCDTKESRLALEMLEKEKVNVLCSGGSSADDELLATAMREKMVVCTQDRALIKRLKACGLSVVTLRQKKYLMKK